MMLKHEVIKMMISKRKGGEAQKEGRGSVGERVDLQLSCSAQLSKLLTKINAS